MESQELQVFPGGDFPTGSLEEISAGDVISDKELTEHVKHLREALSQMNREMGQMLTDETARQKYNTKLKKYNEKLEEDLRLAGIPTNKAPKDVDMEVIYKFLENSGLDLTENYQGGGSTTVDSMVDYGGTLNRHIKLKF